MTDASIRSFWAVNWCFHFCISFTSLQFPAQAVNEDRCVRNSLCKHSVSAVKKWIHEFQNLADIFIFFIFWKSEELHFCIDYCKLNVIIIKNHYFLSLISELLDWLSDLTVFSKIDLQNIYHKICIYQNDEWKTVFHTWYRHFEYQVVSFDLINISVIF